MLVGVLVGLLLSVPANARVRQGPRGLGFYSPPTALLRGVHGSVVWARTLIGPAVLTAARTNVLVIYRSVSPLGEPVFVSGTVAIPRGKPPAGGWPVIAYNHGTTGIADKCAPSRGFAYWDRRPVLNGLLRLGYAVVQTDYQGLGTPGVHPYIIGTAEGRDVVDLVRAARAVDPRVGRRWLPLGVSQGGHASLWSAAIAPKWAPELRTVGVVALAPTSHVAQALPPLARITTPLPLTGPLAEFLAGAGTDGWALNAVLSPLGRKLMEQVYTQRCDLELTRPNSLGGFAPAALFRPGADLRPFVRILAANDPGTLTIKAPVFMGQGTKDTEVPEAWTDQLVAQLRSHGAHVQYNKLYPATHGRAEVFAAYNDYRRFIAVSFHHG